MSLAEWAIRRLIIVIVATATVSAIGAGALGFFMGRNSSDDGPKASADPEPVSDVPTEAPPTGTPAVVVPPSSEATAAPAAGDSPIGAPTRVNQFGVPVGYPHTEAGAISACGNYIAATSMARNREHTRSHDLILSISDEETAKRLSDLLSGIDAETAKNFGVPSVISPQFTLNHRVIGYRVSNFNGGESKVEVLSAIAAGVSGESPNLQPAMHWGTDICTINWDGSDWKLRDVSGGVEGHAMTERSSEAFERFALSGVTS
ncbi:hypothetical protein [Parafrankia sp. BMG5.11]|uniref:hypothetical protein n=1 Tax=Parafrankia sp. BMG5.11 TaxID=222540 RepID=UPI00103A68B8|nr:hypothetical protein [Parafrankia sp. BMG5.11]TCJ35416.1 hypothetical protein E0504_28310 [Parafrankia sp. BMG5.11]